MGQRSEIRGLGDLKHPLPQNPGPERDRDRKGQEPQPLTAGDRTGKIRDLRPHLQLPPGQHA